MREDKNDGPNFVRAWRRRAGLTQSQLAERLGTSHNQVQHLESGERALTARWLRRLGRALGATPGMLLDMDPAAADADLHALLARLRPDAAQRRRIAAVIEALARVDAEPPDEPRSS